MVTLGNLTERIPPQNLEAEKSVLGGILLENSSINAILEILKEEDFYKKAHRLIFAKMVELDNKGEPIDLVSLKEALKKANQLDEVGGITYLSSLLETVPTASNISYYSKLVKEKSLARELLSSAINIANLCYEGETDAEELLAKAEKSIYGISQKSISKGPVSLKEIIQSSFETIDNIYKNKGLMTGIETGFIEFDQKTLGLHPSDLIIIAGRPGMGKTSFCLNIAEHVAVEKRLPVVIFSLEMSDEQLFFRLLCSKARVDAHKLRTGYLENKFYPKLTMAASQLSEAPIYIDDSPTISILEMRAKARKLKSSVGLALLIVDYLQLMRGDGKFENRQQEISGITRALKALAKELKIPVVALSQLNRAPEGRKDNKPILSDLRESGAIEQDADVVAFIYRDEVYNKETKDENIAEILIRKQRNGPIGDIRLVFRSECARFENLSTRPEPWE